MHPRGCGQSGLAGSPFSWTFYGFTLMVPGQTSFILSLPSLPWALVRTLHAGPGGLPDLSLGVPPLSQANLLQDSQGVPGGREEPSMGTPAAVLLGIGTWILAGCLCQCPVNPP